MGCFSDVFHHHKISVICKTDSGASLWLLLELLLQVFITSDQSSLSYIVDMIESTVCTKLLFCNQLFWMENIFSQLNRNPSHISLWSSA